MKIQFLCYSKETMKIQILKFVEATRKNERITEFIYWSLFRTIFYLKNRLLAEVTFNCICNLGILKYKLL